MSLPHSETCCICSNNLNDIKIQTLQDEIDKNPIFCNYCIEGAVCHDCYDKLIENDIDEKCPICRRIDWNPIIIEMNIIDQELIENDKEELEFKCTCTCNNICDCIYLSILNFLKVMAIFTLYTLIFFIIGYVISLFNVFDYISTRSIIGYIGIMILRGFIMITILILFGLCCGCCSVNDNQLPDDFFSDNLAGLVLYWFIKIAQFFYS
jgi:hypothetical protein